MNSSFLKNLKDGKVLIQFGGQGGGFYSELKRLFTKEPRLENFFRHCFDSLSEMDNWVKKYSANEFAFNLEKWLRNDMLPPPLYLEHFQVTLPGIYITQMAYLNLLHTKGFAVKNILPNMVGIAGHSQGIGASCVLSIAQDQEDFFRVFKDFVKFFVLSGIHLFKVFKSKLPEESLKLSQKIDDQIPKPMAAITGVEYNELLNTINEFNQNKKTPEFKIYLGLVNGIKSFVVVGYEQALIEFRQVIMQKWQEKEFRWIYLEISVPFHCKDILGQALDPFLYDLKQIGFSYTIADLKMPVFSTHTGEDLRFYSDSDPNLGRILFDLIFLKLMDWNLSLSPVRLNGVQYILDLGPGTLGYRLTQNLMNELKYDVEILSVVNKNQRNQLLEI